MTAPIVLPPLRAANFDIIWFGIIMTIVMEMGLIHPPVGLNIFVIRNVAPDIPLRDVIWGTLPFVLLMMGAVLLLCIVPEISWLPDLVMRPDSYARALTLFAFSALAARLTGARRSKRLNSLVAASSSSMSTL